MFGNSSNPKIDQQIHSLIEQAGFRSPTPLQRVVIPSLIQRKDLIISTGSGRGKTAAIIASAIINNPSFGSKLKSLILSHEKNDISKFKKTAVKISTGKNKMPQTVCLGLDDNIQKELRQLQKQPAIIIGTTERVIDHIRRGNLKLEEVEETFINCPRESDDSFNQDILFIYSKFKKKTSTALFYQSSEINEELLKLTKRAVVISPENWRKYLVTHEAYRAQKNKKNTACSRIILAKKISNGIIFIKNLNLFKDLNSLLSKNGYNSIVIASGKHTGASIPERTFYITNVPHLLQEFQNVRNVIILDLAFFQNEYTRITNLLPDQARLISIYLSGEAKILNNLEEETTMSINRKASPQNTDAISGKIKNLVHRVRREEDPEVLDWFKKVLKKNVPLHLRSYVAALLLKESGIGKGSYIPPVKKSPSSAKKKKTSSAVKSSFSSVGKSGFQTLFVSIGKNRRVFPRDLSGMLCNTLDMSNESIGNIKVLDNYSFVDISPDFAQKAIDSLDGTDFRGRKITVNFARKKD